MFDISFSELFIIAIVALLVLGPERLPKVARTMGHLLGRAQRYMNDVKRDIQKEMELEDIKDLKEEMTKASSSVKSSISDLGKEFKDPLKDFEQDLKDPFQEARDAVQNLRKEAEGSFSSLTESIKGNTQESSTNDATDTASINNNGSSENTTDPDTKTAKAEQTPPVAKKTAAALRAGTGLPTKDSTSSTSSTTTHSDTHTDQPRAKPRHTDLPSSADTAGADGAD